MLVEVLLGHKKRWKTAAHLSAGAKHIETPARTLRTAIPPSGLRVSKLSQAIQRDLDEHVSWQLSIHFSGTGQTVVGSDV